VQTLPTLEALAAASEKEVLRLWEGLGYYRRARDLHRAAQLVVAEHGGAFPEDLHAAGRLPGLGRYTRNAVLSQAFDQRLPILEANTQRVLSRLFGRRDDPRSGLARRWLWQAAAALLPKARVGSFNQALMELGALVCTSTRPRCRECPVAARCAAHRLGLQEAIPPRAGARAITAVREVAVLVRRRGRFLLVQRPAEGRWAGLWEFPHGPVAEGEDETTAAHRIAHDLAGLDIRLGPELLTVRHGVTRYAITLLGFEAEHARGEFASDFYRHAVWVKPAQLAGYPVSAAQRRLAQALTAPARQPRFF
jgi:A/G-specific adenine glycosylase